MFYKSVVSQIDQAIHVDDVMLLILSANSMQSEWVKTEIAHARKREMAITKRVLYPLRLVAFDEIREWGCFDADSGKNMSQDMREYFVPDFSLWRDHTSYMEALNALLRDLRVRKEPSQRDEESDAR